MDRLESPRCRPRRTFEVATVGLAAAAICAAVVQLFPAPACAESRREYVNRYVLLNDWIVRSEIWVSSHLEDPGLCRLAHSISERHVELARRMTPPPEFVSIHPHLLLIIENAERMFDHAAAGNRAAFHRYRRIVHDEQRLIAELLQAEGHFMPVIAP